MALTHIPPAPARVRWDRVANRPARVSWAGRELAVKRLAAVRDERHAYQPDRGPRLTFVVEATDGSAVLVLDTSTRRWYVEAVDLAA